MSDAMNRRMPVFDGHNDTLLRLHIAEDGGGRSFFERSDSGHIDLPRAEAGGLAGGLFAVFAPSVERSDEWAGREVDRRTRPLPPPVDGAYAARLTGEVVDRLYEVEAASAGRLRVARTVGELRSCMREGVLGAVLHFEGAEAIDPGLSRLGDWYERGLRSLGLVWSRANAFGEGVPFRFPHSPDTGPGLSDAGRALVRACNEMGVLVDLSHLNERGFFDVAGLSEKPLVVTHAAAHALCPHARNLTDRQLDAIGDSGGVVGVNFAALFLRPDGKNEPDTPLELIVRHAVYIAERIGIEHVALGSDFDGAVVPNELGDVAGLPRLVEALRAGGFDEAALRKITHENWLRVLGETWGEEGWA